MQLNPRPVNDNRCVARRWSGCFCPLMDNHPHSRSRWLRGISLGACAAVSLATFNLQAGAPAPKNPVVPVEAVDWKARTISPVTNPIFFEDAVIRSEIRPIFAYHNIHDDFLGGGDAQLYALQIRYALTDRLAFIATQDGYFDINNDAIANPEGWMDIALGFKYALIDDIESEFILTPGFTFHIPTGERDVFQGRGGGEWNLFVSTQKGYGDLHLSGNLGVRLPNNGSEQSTMLHYSAMVDYHTCRWFIPFITFNAFTVLDEGGNIPLNTEGYDVINFGSSNTRNRTQGALGAGFRSRILDNVDLGFAYEKAVIKPEGLFDDRFTVDICIRF